MSLNSDQLDAFFAVARCGSFSKAAEQLFISQPALSQRIGKLEETLDTNLFVRSSAGVTLTEFGLRLSLYCQQRRDLEKEFLPDSKDATANRGVIRVAGFSSLMRSVVMPALSELIKANTEIQVELITRELRELPGLLRSGESDFVFTDRKIENGPIESVHLGYEENVLIEPSKSKMPIPAVLFDHDLEDRISYDYMKKFGKKKTGALRRSFLDEAYGLIDAVERGWGRAVVPRHMIESNQKIKIVDPDSALRTDVYLNSYSLPYTTPLQKQVREALTSGVPLRLQAR